MRLTIFVPGQLKSPNGGHLHWSKHYRIARDWKERTSQHLLAKIARVAFPDPSVPKRISMTAHVNHEWDEDNLAIGLKPVRDALKAMRVIDDDRPSAGHIFAYAQIVHTGKGARAKRGVEIEITVHPCVILAEEGGG